MKIQKNSVKLACASLSFVAAATNVSATEWRLYGFADKQATLYSTDVHSTSVGFRVWVRVWKTSDLEKLALAAKSEQFIKPWISGHPGIPPALLDGANLEKDTVTYALVLEASANSGQVKPTGQILYEIDCKEERFRALQLVDSQNRTHISHDDWEYPIPGSNGAALSRVVCTSK